MERKYSSDSKEETERPQINGATTAAAFGRGGTPSGVRYVPSEVGKPQVNGATTAVSFGRGGTDSKILYVRSKERTGEGSKE